MRPWLLMACFLVLLMAASAFENKPPQTIEGCMVSLNGVFTLGTPNGERYVLKGDHDTLFSYNGKQVRITGTLKKSSSGSPASPGEPRTLKVTVYVSSYSVGIFFADTASVRCSTRSLVTSTVAVALARADCTAAPELLS